MQITRTTNPNGTFRYTLPDGKVITKGSKRRSEWGTIYRLSAGFGTNNTGDITATLHARSDLAGKGSSDLTRAGWVIIAVVEIIDGDTEHSTEEEQSQTSDQATPDSTPKPGTQVIRIADRAAGTLREVTEDGWIVDMNHGTDALGAPTAWEVVQPSDTKTPGYTVIQYYGDTEIERATVQARSRWHAARTFIKGKERKLDHKHADGDGTRWTMTERNGFPAGSILVTG